MSAGMFLLALSFNSEMLGSVALPTFELDENVSVSSLLTPREFA